MSTGVGSVLIGIFLILGTLGLTHVFALTLASVFVPTGINVAAEVPFPEVGGTAQIKLEFDNVVTAGNLAIESRGVPPDPAPSSGFRIVGQPDPPFGSGTPYFDVSFGGTFAGTIQVCANYDDAFLSTP